jgi:TatD DNase family protein
MPDLLDGRLLLDAHAHPFDGFPRRRELEEVRVKVILNSSSQDDLQQTLSLSRSLRPYAFFFAGLHPSVPDQEVERLVEWMRTHEGEVDGIGEVGLDRRFPTQERWYRFRRQLELAEETGRPVAVHSRGMVDEVLRCLPSYRLRSVLLHWFAGTASQLAKCMEMGCYVSFGPAATYSKKLRSLMTLTNRDRLLLETDSPVSYGACFEGRPSSPLLIPSVYFCAAEALKVDQLELEELVLVNASKFLGRPLEVR